MREVFRWTYGSEPGSYISQTGHNRRQGRDQTLIFERDQKCSGEYHQDVQEKVVCDRAYRISLQFLAIQFYSLDHIRVKAKGNPAPDQLADDQDPDRLQSAACGGRTSADDHKEEQDHLADERPDFIVGTHISCSSQDGSGLKGRIDCCSSDGIVLAGNKQDGCDQNCRYPENQEIETEFRVFKQLRDPVLKRQIIQVEVDPA